MKIGVSTVPCGVCRRPRRAAPSVCKRSKRMDMDTNRYCPSLKRKRSMLHSSLTLQARTALIAAQRQPISLQFLAHLAQRRLAEVLRFQQLIRRALNQIAERVDA